MGSGLGWGCTLVHSLAHFGMHNLHTCTHTWGCTLALDVGKKSRAAHGQLPGTPVHLTQSLQSSAVTATITCIGYDTIVKVTLLLSLTINTNVKNTFISNTYSDSSIVNYMNMNCEEDHYCCFRRHLQIFRFIQSSPRILQHPPCPLSFAVKHHHRQSFV